MGGFKTDILIILNTPAVQKSRKNIELNLYLSMSLSMLHRPLISQMKCYFL